MMQMFCKRGQLPDFQPLMLTWSNTEGILKQDKTVFKEPMWPVLVSREHAKYRWNLTNAGFAENMVISGQIPLTGTYASPADYHAKDTTSVITGIVNPTAPILCNRRKILRRRSRKQGTRCVK